VQKPRLKKMLGQCYVYRNNSYSCPDKKNDYWNIFRKIIDWVDTKERGFHFIYEEFQIDRDGKIAFYVDNVAPYLNKEWWNVAVPFSGFQKIAEKEYNIEKLRMLEEIKTQTKMRKILNSKWD